MQCILTISITPKCAYLNGFCLFSDKLVLAGSQKSSFSGNLLSEKATLYIMHINYAHRDAQMATCNPLKEFPKNQSINMVRHG